MNLNTRYIDEDDFKSYTGIDLSVQLAVSDNPSDTTKAFLRRNSDRIEAWLEANYHRRIEVEYPQFTNFQKEQYKLALIEQSLYVFKNGDISVDSGYDPEKGIIASQGVLNGLIIAPNAKTHLQLAGLLTRKLKTKGRSGFMDNEWWY